MKWLVAKVAW